jgi:hypothetical protein
MLALMAAPPAAGASLARPSSSLALQQLQLAAAAVEGGSGQGMEAALAAMSAAGPALPQVAGPQPGGGVAAAAGQGGQALASAAIRQALAAAVPADAAPPAAGPVGVAGGVLVQLGAAVAEQLPPLPPGGAPRLAVGLEAVTAPTAAAAGSGAAPGAEVALRSAQALLENLALQLPHAQG